MQQPKTLDELDLKHQFAHRRFQYQLKDISLNQAKDLLKDLHLLVLKQEAMMHAMFKDHSD